MIRVVLMQLRRLDRDALAALIRQSSGFNLVAALASDWETVAVCKQKRPNSVILDTSLPDHGAATLANCLIQNRYARQAVLLGDGPNKAWEEKASRISNTAYLTRSVSQDELFAHLARHGTADATSADDPADSTTQEPPKRGRTPLEGAQGVSRLSSRELEVLRLLAEGNSIRQCAEKLHLAVSTLDNHKTRVMKKLNVHKNVELVRLAIREGIIEP